MMRDRFFGWSTIYGVEGEHPTPYLTRIWFWRLRLHIFHRGDADPDCHDHPWDFWTFPLTSYVEEVANPDISFLSRLPWAHEIEDIESHVLGNTVTRQVVPAFRRSWRPATHCHRVLGRYAGTYAYEDTAAGRLRMPQVDDRRVVTLVWSGRSRRPWGFLRNREGKWCWTPWRDYVFGGGKHAPCEPAGQDELRGNKPTVVVMDEYAPEAPRSPFFDSHEDLVERHMEIAAGKFALRDRVRKIKGSSWQGRVVGFYSTWLTPIGYCVESEREPGSVQLYPEAALELAPFGSEAR